MTRDGNTFVITVDELLMPVHKEYSDLAERIEDAQRRRDEHLDTGRTLEAQRYHDLLRDLKAKQAALEHKHYTLSFDFSKHLLHESRMASVCHRDNVTIKEVGG